MRVIVWGPEHSGTTWLTQILMKHPAVSDVAHLTWPSSKDTPCGPNRTPVGGVAGKMAWLRPEDIAPTSMRLVILTRDASICARAIQQITDGEKRQLNALEWRKAVAETLRIWRGPRFLASYEALMLLRSTYLVELFKALRLPLDYDWGRVEYRDGNVKYLQAMG